MVTWKAVGGRAKVWPRRVASIACVVVVVAVVVACSLPKLPALSDGGIPLPSCGSGSGICLALLAGGIGGGGYADGTGSAARFDGQGIAIDSAGNLYMSDPYNGVVRKITPGAVVTTFVGDHEMSGSADGSGSAAQFGLILGLAIDAAGNIYVADQQYDTIRAITPAGVVTTLAGSPGTRGSADGTGSAASFYGPEGVAVDGSGNVYVADSANATIRMITPAGVVTTIAGLAGSPGSADGNGSAARFTLPARLVVDGAGNIYISDTTADTIRKLTPQGDVTTFAGLAGVTGSTDGTGSAARFHLPQGLAVDDSGNVFVADTANLTLRKITPAGAVSTLVGTAGVAGSADGSGSAAQLANPLDVAVDAAGHIFVNDVAAIREVTPAGVVTTFAGMLPAQGSADGIGSAAKFFGPAGLTVDRNGVVYVADLGNDTIRAITPDGMVSTFAGSAGQRGSSDGTGSAARFQDPEGVAVGSSGIVYVADGENEAIRAITPQGVVTTLAGHPGSGGSADGVGSGARFAFPTDLAIDGSGNVFVTDITNSNIRMVTPAGVVTTLAGLAGTRGSADGIGSAATFYGPGGIAVDAAGNVYVADQGNFTIRKIAPGGVVTTLAGLAGSSGSVDGTGSAARFANPNGLAIDAAGNLYTADVENSAIRKITPAGVVTTIAGGPGVQIIRLGTSPGFVTPSHAAISGDSLVITDSDAILVLEHAVQ